jgi:hypothetical protein
MSVLALAVILAVADHPCLLDIDRLCHGVQPGGGRIRQCLKKHAAELSPACKQNLNTFIEHVQEIKASCEGDADKFCSGVIPGRGAVARCLRGRLPDLSPACRKDLEEVQQRGAAVRANYEAIKVACSLDQQRFCPNEDLGGGGIYRCLRQHEPDLTVDCKRALSAPPPPH